MGRPKAIVNTERGRRLKILIEEQDTTGTALASDIPVSQQTVSKIINGKANLTDAVADRVIELYPQYRKEWLMGYDDIKTRAQKTLSDLPAWGRRYDAIRTLVSDRAELLGYSFVDWAPYPTDEGYNDSGIWFERADGKGVFVRSTIAKDILEYIDFKVDRLIKEASDNGIDN